MKSALIVDEPWIGMILSLQKNWEIRTRNTKKRGEVGLIRKGSGLIVGSAELADAFTIPRDEDFLHNTFDKHHSWAVDLMNYGNPEKPLYAWVLNNARAFKEPVPYTHPRGAVIWVKVPDW